MSCRPAISQSWWWVDILSRMLEPGEREVVHGDLAESGGTGSQALREVLGLVLRRQAALWRHWQPWLTLFGLIIPLGMLLSVTSRSTAGLSAVYLWMYADNWDWNLLGYRMFWYQFIDTATATLITYLALGCWSWTSGFVLGSASRGMLWVNGVLFCVMLAFGVIPGAPLYSACYQQYVHSAFGFPSFAHGSNDPVFALTFYRVMFPLIVQAVLVLLPSLFGMRQGARAVRFRLPLRTILWAAAIANLAAIVVQNPDLWMFLRLQSRPGIWWQGWPILVLRFVVYWPLVYVLATTGWRRLPDCKAASHSLQR